MTVERFLFFLMSQANQCAHRKDMRIDEKKNNMCLTAVYNDLCLGLSARARARDLFSSLLSFRLSELSLTPEASIGDRLIHLTFGRKNT